MRGTVIAIIVIAVCLFGYSAYVQFAKHPSDLSVPKRVWAAVIVAAGLVGAAAHSLFSGATP